LGRARRGDASDIDFFFDKDAITGEFYFNPVRPGTGVEPYDALPVDDLTSIDSAPCPPSSTPGVCAPYLNSPLEARVGLGYVFETDGGDGHPRYGAVRVTHIGQNFMIFDWAFQGDPGNPELLVQGVHRSP
jgi:hypothetical protein